MPCCNIWEKFEEKNSLVKEYKKTLDKPHETLGNETIQAVRKEILTHIN